MNLRESAHAFQVLEYDEVFDQVIACARSSEGRNLLAEQSFITDETELLVLQKQAGVFRDLLLETEYPLANYPEINKALEDSRVEGSMLEMEDCAAAAYFVDTAAKEMLHIREFNPDAAVELCTGKEEIPDEIPKLVWRYLDSGGNLMEEKIPELKSIARKIRSAEQAARHAAYSYLKNAQYHEIWTSDEPALRDGRLVLPLQENFRGRLSGIIHTRSASGNTLFFEPSEIVEANNSVSEQQSAYQIEVQKILRRLSDIIHKCRPALMRLQKKIAVIDDRCARARFGIQHNAYWLPVQQNSSIRLIMAAHPLLGKQAVPISLEIDTDPSRFLLLSGPNTGGKTVALKTLGLCAAMHQTGLPVPAASGSCLPLFSRIFADIGDEQSIERALSTFSGHLQRIKSILENIDHQSLVLLDELGSGTDPDEAGALACAVCEFLGDSGCMGMITTHLWSLKEFAFARDDFFNAAMAFDEETHAPTYAVVPGLPGSSHALDTAEAMDFPESVLKKARSIYSSQQTSTTALLKRLAEKEQNLAENTLKLQQQQSELQSRAENIEQQRQALLQREAEVRKGQIHELQNQLAAGRSTIEGLIRSIRENELNSKLIAEVRDGLKAVESDIERARDDTRQLQSRARTQEDFHNPAFEGARVKILSNGKQGLIQRNAGTGKWRVLIGSITLTMHENDFIVISDSDKSLKVYHPPKSNKAVLTEAPLTKMEYSIDLRGKRVHEAENELIQQIDNAIMNGSTMLAIIHGKGTGALQQAIHTILASHPSVDSYKFSRPELGGSGRTEVFFTD
ncbi:endonuclease MutS2 [Spirochaeta dissipatitropha]